MTPDEINERIARWMGWQWSDKHGWPMWYAPGEEIQPFAFRAGGFRYMESLDAQQPVWEALRNRGQPVALGPDNGDGYVASVDSRTTGSDYPYYGFAATPAEAAARACAAAIEVLYGHPR